MIRSSQYTDARDSQRRQVLQAAQGYYAETTSRGQASGASNAMISGTFYYVAIALLAGDVVTNIITMPAVLGSGFSGVKLRFGLYTKSGGALLASTGDVSAAHGSAGGKVNAVTVAYTVPTTDVYWMAGISIATTGPALIRGGTTNAGYDVAGAAIGSYGAITGQTDLPATFAPVYGSGSGLGYWLAVS